MGANWIQALGAALLLSFAACAGEATASSMKPVILLTAFEPFGGSSFNTSWDVVSAFEGREIAGHVIRTARLKVVYDAIGGPLAEAIEKTKPVAVVSFGEGTAVVQIERVAKNGYHAARPPDNDGKPPPRATIIPGAAESIPSGLPVDAILAKLAAAAKIQASASSDAGGYLCNECFYRLMAQKNAPATRGFVHLPIVPPSDMARRKQLDAAVRIIVETIVEKLK